jgi:hypothetical protein
MNRPAVLAGALPFVLTATPLPFAMVLSHGTGVIWMKSENKLLSHCTVDEMDRKRKHVLVASSWKGKRTIVHSQLVVNRTFCAPSLCVDDL